jgi:hypothetical protein
MNIFALNYDPIKAAEFHCDKHIVKMPLETAQMLCTIQNKYGIESPYRSTHANHPCTIWAGQTTENYQWLWELGIALCKEYTHRYGREHACERIINIVRHHPENLEAKGFTKFAQAMPDEYKCDNSIIAYQQYYRGAKSHLAKWTNRKIPQFMLTGKILAN